MIRVLVAEDERPIARYISNIIEMINPEFQIVRIVYNGKQAIQALEEEDIDVVFLDINMPIVNGIKVLEHIFTEKLDVMSIMVTGYQDFSYAQSALRYRAFDYLLKPLDKELLKESLKKAQIQIGRKRRERELFLMSEESLDIKNNQEDEKKNYYFAVMYIGSNHEIWDLANLEEQDRTEKLFIKLMNLYVGEKNYNVIVGQHNSEKLLIIDERQKDIEIILGNILNEMQSQIAISIEVTSEIITSDERVEVEEQMRQDLSKCMCIEDSTLICYPMEIEEDMYLMEKSKLDDVVSKISNKTASKQVIRRLSEIVLLTGGVRCQVEYGTKGLLGNLCGKSDNETQYIELEDKMLGAIRHSFEEQTLIREWKTIITEFNATKILL